MQCPRQQKQRPMRRIIVRILLSPSWAARSRRTRSRSRPYIPSRNPIRAAAHRYRITLAWFRSVRQEKRQTKIHRALPFSRPVPQESRITAATHRGRRYRPNPRSSAAPLCSRLTHSEAHRMRPRQMQCRAVLHLRLPHPEARHNLSAAQECQTIRTVARYEIRKQNPFSSAVPLCKLQTWQARSQQQIIRLRLLLRDPIQQERSARPSADAIPSPCSRRHAFPRMETPRSRSRTMFQPSSPAARCSRPAESVWMAAPQIGSIPHPQRRYPRQRRLPTAKLVRPHVRPRGLMQRVRQNSTLRSAQFPPQAAAQKSRYRRLAHKLLLFPPLLPNGRAGNRRPRLLWAA